MATAAAGRQVHLVLARDKTNHANRDLQTDAIKPTPPP